MFITILKSKIHAATITAADLYYQGSITIDEKLMNAAGLLESEKVEVLNINTGGRLETYCIKGKAGSGVICLNGPAARSASVGDKIIILAYALVDVEEVASVKAKIVKPDERNRIKD